MITRTGELRSVDLLTNEKKKKKKNYVKTYVKW